MPFYEYECQACKFYTEVMQKISDAPLTKCPSCGKRALKKLVSAPVFRLKGGGWYETDFKSDKENKRNLLGADKEEAKAEAKSEAPADKGAAAAKDKGAESKGEAAKGEPAKGQAKGEPPARGARSRVALPARSARAAARKPKRAAKSKSGRRR
jgi:putative FmdB family regulatory protein